MNKMHIAPVQGHTDAAWRHFHSEVYGGNNNYYTPFIRLEKGEFRKHDLKDYLSPLNDNHTVIPQVIFRDMTELRPLIEGLAEKGATRIDLNSGCPFPLQTAKGRGAAFVKNIEEYSKLPDLLAEFPDLSFSLKMRLGFDDEEDWRKVIHIINSLPLDYVTLHPRIAKDQYKGDLRLNQFEAFLKESKKPVVYNGEIKNLDDAKQIKEHFPEIDGIMIARGLLGRPSLIREIEKGEELDIDERREKMMEFHNRLFDYYSAELCGDHQILSKMKPFWEYAQEEIGRKAWKAIAKASNMAKYQSAVALISD